MARKTLDKYTQTELKRRKRSVNIALFILVISLTVYTLASLYFYLSGYTDQLWLLIVVFILFFLTTVSVNLMRTAIDRQIKEKNR